MSKQPIVVDCPNCAKAVIWGNESKYRPFCSKRCQLIDLGQWADEEHKIATKEDNPMADLLQDVDAMSEEQIEALAAKLLHGKGEQ
ncbi:DNA gyrase inhibitor YacG [Corallincola holothuriorum]|uniref:DNA gyrase inhibitor YacG n=1 Tax=Corallincola holothuriorum TaxID=2282215 RepID=A0A368NIB3_9GAMM|nr:DNA gyrase inhibitor YacG [Corallincola holothuriorum]RCU49896.1 DNA gyrase inhibitor YacG [Corallincola holothuriorum]